jgi:sporulation protein YlmC with PRC-barrel domain
MRLSELLGLRVHTDSGSSLGHVHDVRGELREHELRVTGLVVGELGVLERLGIGAPGSAARIRGRDTIPWSQVLRADKRGVVVRDRPVEEE